jgi:ligand-binding sensor domain-containing protein/two-component sensor histidine kinase
MRIRTPWLILTLLTVWGGSPGCPPAKADDLDPSRELVQYAHRAWTKRDGLPQNTVEAIAQTPDGYLWFGTVEGLARFDGSSFRIYNTRNTPQLKLNYISALFVAHDSTMYIGNYGGPLLRWRQGMIRPVEGPKGSEQLVIRKIIEDRQGNVWMACNSGLMLVKGDSIRKIYGVPDGLPHPMVYSVCETGDGSLLVATPAGIWIRNEECFEPWIKGLSTRTSKGYGFTFHTPHVLDAVPTELLCDRDGGLWIGTWDHGLFRYKDKTLSPFGRTEIPKDIAIHRLFQDRKGSVWIGTGSRGLFRCAGGRISSFSSTDGLSGDEVMSLFEDREGNLWVGVSTAGVNRFTNSRFTTFRVGTSVIENMIWSVAEDPRGRILVSTAAGRMFSFDKKHFLPAPKYEAKMRGVGAAYLRDRSGAFWVAGSNGLMRYEGGSREQLLPSAVTGAAEDRYGRIWFTGSEGIFVYDHGRFTRVDMGLSKHMKTGRQILFDREGQLWFATRSAGVGCLAVPPPPGAPLAIDSADFRWYPLLKGNNSAWVMTMSMDSLGGLWIATMGAGLKAVRGDSIVTITSAEGLPEEVVYAVLPDNEGSLWFSSNNGVFRAKVDELYALLEGKRGTVDFESFGVSDGMYSDECNGGYQASAVKGKDGRLWFPTTAGVVMVDPGHMPTNATPPAVVVERVKVDNIEGMTTSGVSYPPGSGELEFHFIGMSFTAPERVRYRYVLEGFNKQWIDAGDRRDAFYTNIPPGSYRFRVQAANNNGIWNEAGASVAFTLRPHFYQTIWFALMIGLCLAGVMFAGHFMYKRDRDREVRASQLESELAQAQVQILEMQLQPHFLFNTLNSIMVLIRQEPDLASRMVARLSEFLRLTLDSAGAQEVSLRRELEFLDRYLQIERIRFGDRLQFTQHVDPCLLDAHVPNLILQPLVENAIRHGVSKQRGPATITVSAERANGSITIHVRDNGAGLASRHGGKINEGIGIRNTRQRLRHLYGEASTFSLESPAEGGVDVVLTLPYNNPGT